MQESIYTLHTKENFIYSSSDCARHSNGGGVEVNF